MIQKVVSLNSGRQKLIEVESDKNFSIKRVKPNEIISVPEDQQMLLSGALLVEGQFNNFGETVLIDLEDSDTVTPPFPPLPPDNFSHFKILSGEEKTIPQNQQMNVFGAFTNFGTVKNFGEMNLTKIFQDDPDQAIVLPDDNFSHREIIANETKTVPLRQQMVVVGMMKNFGTLKVNGSLALLSGEVPTDLEDDYLPPYKIDANEIYKIKTNRLMFLPRSLVNFGQLNNFGQLILGGII